MKIIQFPHYFLFEKWAVLFKFKYTHIKNILIILETILKGIK